jgi:hypothetical protein
MTDISKKPQLSSNDHLLHLLEDRERKHDAFRLAETEVNEGRAESYSAEMSAFDVAHGEALDWLNDTDHLSDLLSLVRGRAHETNPYPRCYVGRGGIGGQRCNFYPKCLCGDRDALSPPSAAEEFTSAPSREGSGSATVGGGHETPAVDYVQFGWVPFHEKQGCDPASFVEREEDSNAIIEGWHWVPAYAAIDTARPELKAGVCPGNHLHWCAAVIGKHCYCHALCIEERLSESEGEQ